MGTKPKTRIGITVEGRVRELFSVRELSTGDLLITMRHAEAYEDGPDAAALGSQRYSVHRSLKSPGITIKQTIDLKDGRKITTAQFRKPVDGEVLSPLYAKTCPSLNRPRYEMNIGNRDRVVLLTEYDLGNQLMFYAVAVSTVPPSGIIIENCSIHAIQFKHFWLFVFSGYFMVVSLPGSDLTHAMTSPRQVDGVPDLPSFPQNISPNIVQSFDPEGLSLWIKASLSRLAGATLERHRRLVFTEGTSPSPEILAIVAKGLQVWLPHPANKYKQGAG